MSPSSRRAWIEIQSKSYKIIKQMSPSSRRAWIEIFTRSSMSRPPRVALLAEGVDRNNRKQIVQYKDLESPSSRRAWIEILLP